MEDLSFMIYREYLFLLQKDDDSDRYNSTDQCRPRRLWARNHVLESRSGTNGEGSDQDAKAGSQWYGRVNQPELKLMVAAGSAPIHM